MKKSISNEEIVKVRQMCENYLSEMERIHSNNLRVEELTERLKSDIPDFSKWLYKREIEDLESQIQKDTEETGYFRWALDHLPEKDQSIMEQLYVDGYAWDSVIDDSGNVVPNGTVSKARRRSFHKMAELISQMKNEVMVESDILDDKVNSDETSSPNESGV